jgi:hypothetical protein
MQRGEGIIGDFQPRRRYCADESRFAGVRHAEQPDVGQHFQFKLELA